MAPTIKTEKYQTKPNQKHKFPMGKSQTQNK